MRFLILLIWVGAAFGAQDVWTRIERIVAVGDLHGDYEQTVTVLRMAGLLDARGNWSGGKTHFVQVGDTLDRGIDGRKILDLLMRLERQAQRAGGRVHALIGNHEAMNLYGDLRYVAPAEYESWGGPEKRLKLLGAHGRYGKWIRSNNAVVKINRTLFLHGGIGPNYAAKSIREINESVREELQDFSKLKDGIVMDPEGPLWYRHLSRPEDSTMEAFLKAMLEQQEADRVVVGHTVQPEGIRAQYGGRVILIDAGIARVYNGGRAACLVLEKGHAFALENGIPRNLEIDFTWGEILPAGTRTESEPRLSRR